MHTQYRRAGGFVKRKRDLVQHGGGHAAQHADEQRAHDRAEMLRAIDASRPEGQRLGAHLDAECFP